MNNDNSNTIILSSDFQCKSLNNVQYIEITDDDAGQRLDNFLFRHLKKVPKTRVYNLLRRGEVRVNKSRKKAEYKLLAQDVLRLPPIRIEAATDPEQHKGASSAHFAAKLEGATIYEDKGILVMNKPPGLAVHGGSGIHLGMIEIIRLHFPHAKNWELVHRLDRETSGLVMIAKKRSELRRLHQAFRDNTVHKEYWAILVGQLEKDRHVAEGALKKNQLTGGARIVKVDPQGQPAKTIFEVQGRSSQHTWVLAKPITGRTHQIRVHAQSLGCPILGDDKYADQEDNQRAKKQGFSGLMLHARQLTIPRDNEPDLVLQAEPPPHLMRWLQQNHNVSFDS